MPTTADTTPPTIVGFKCPPANSDGDAADPVEVDVTAYDDRGDLKQVNLYADGALVGSVPVFPFQFRYTPPASAVGSTVKLTAEAVDKAGNKSTRDLLINVARRRRRWSLSPVPVNQPTLVGLAARRSDDDLRQRRVPQRPALVLVRVAAQRHRDRRRHGGELHAHRRRPRPDDRLPDVGDQHGRHG